MATRDQVKQWFQTGDYPTQEQFWTLLDSVLFSGEVAITDIAGLLAALQAKADKSAFDSFEQGERLAFNSDGYYDIPQGYLLEKVIVLYATPGTLKIGTTAGGTEVLPVSNWTANDFDPITLDKYAKTTRRIFFGGLPSGTSIIFLKRLIKQ